MGTPAVAKSACSTHVDTHNSRAPLTVSSGLHQQDTTTNSLHCSGDNQVNDVNLTVQCSCPGDSSDDVFDTSVQLGRGVAEDISRGTYPHSEPRLNTEKSAPIDQVQRIVQETFLSIYNKTRSVTEDDSESSASEDNYTSDSCISIDECDGELGNSDNEVNGPSIINATNNSFKLNILQPFSSIFRRGVIADNLIKMGNLQGSEGKKSSAGKSPAKGKKDKLGGKKSPAKELLKSKGQAPAAPSVAAPVKRSVVSSQQPKKQQPQPAESSQQKAGSPEAEVQPTVTSSGGNGVGTSPSASGSRPWDAGEKTTTYVVTDSWRHVKKLAIQTPSTTATVGSSSAGDPSLLTPQSRESSSESVFTDPLTPQGFAETHSQSIASSYYSDAGSIITKGESAAFQPNNNNFLSPYDAKMGKPQQNETTSDDLSVDMSSADPDDVTLTLMDSHEQLTDTEDSELLGAMEKLQPSPLAEKKRPRSMDVLDEEVHVSASDKSLSAEEMTVVPTQHHQQRTTQPPSSFTVVRHRKVELAPTKLSDDLLGGAV